MWHRQRDIYIYIYMCVCIYSLCIHPYEKHNVQKRCTIYLSCLYFRKLNCVVATDSRLQAGPSRNLGLIHDKFKPLVSFTKRVNWFLVPLNLLLSGNWGSLPRVKWPGRKVGTSSLLVTKLRMRSIYLHQNTSPWLTNGQLDLN
jgi:hypothetical protein